MEIQRSRLLAGAARVVEEHGYTHATVAQITSAARVSRRTFYELFDDREICLLALIDSVIALIEAELRKAGLEGLPWRERVRGGLLTVLSFLDREPALARVCVVEASRGGTAMLERREQVLTRLAAIIDEGRAESPPTGRCAPLTSEGLVGAALAIVHARLLRRERRPLVDLLGELMAMVVLPYRGAAASRRELDLAASERGAPALRRPSAPSTQPDPLLKIPMRLTYRTSCVLQYIDREPGASNRRIADHAGITDQGQISKLLARLERFGLTVNTGDGHLKGEPNAWTLTTLGRQVAQRLTMSNHQGDAESR